MRRCFGLACRTRRPRSRGRPSGAVRKTRNEASQSRRSAVVDSSGCPLGLCTGAFPVGLSSSVISVCSARVLGVFQIAELGVQDDLEAVAALAGRAASGDE